MAVNFFSELFSASPYHMEDDLFTNIPAITQLSQSSSPGTDGFMGYLYQSCWSIIQKDVMAFVYDFFKGAYCPSDISRTTLGDFRPIGLGNFCGKNYFQDPR